MLRLLLITAILTIITVSGLGCALGSASAAYALEAGTAKKLTVEAEDRLIEKILERIEREK